MKKNPTYLLLGLFLGFTSNVFAQTLYLANGASITTTTGSSIIVQGGIQVAAGGTATITGPGIVKMSGSMAATLDMQGNAIPNLDIDNVGGVTLSSAALVTETLQITNGKINLGNFNITLDPNTTVASVPAASYSGAKMINTNGTGQVIKEVDAGAMDYLVPIGFGSNYRPVEITAGSTAGGKVGVKNLDGAAPNKPVSTNSHLLTNWPVTTIGSPAGVSVKGTYLPADVSGTEADIRGYYYNGTAWNSTGGTNLSPKVGAPISAAAGTLTGINKFVLSNAKAFLAGAFTYDASLNITLTSGVILMRDQLRTLASFPTTTPYGIAPYNTTQYTKFNNGAAEIIPNSAAVLAAQVPNSNSIVDWVFLELRTTTSPGNTVQATRSALVQRDGDIVDVDGLSPVTFNGLANGSYVLGVKHRNHHPMFTDLVSNVPAFNESPSSTVDLTTRADADIFGTSGASPTASFKIRNSRNIMWGGDANGNGRVRYSLTGNDPLPILNFLSNDPFGAINGYHREDVGMNGVVRYSLTNNDPLIILQILDGDPFGQKDRQIPN